MIVTIGAMTGFGAVQSSVMAAKSPSASEIRRDLEEGDLYTARKKAQKLLENKPGDSEIQKLMAEVIDQEIARHKEIFTNTVPEELPESAKEEETATWIERAKTLLRLKRYDEAALAAEKVFTYDPENQAASRLMDEIRGSAIKEGKQELLVRHQMYQSEAKERVRLYLDQATQFVAEKRWGAARLALEKTLLLDSANKRASKMYESIQRHLNAAAPSMQSDERHETSEHTEAKEPQ